MLHIHVFLAAPLGTCHMAQPRADQHQGGVAIGERPHHAGSAADLTVQPLDHVVGADARPVLAGKIAVGQRLLNAVLDLLGSLLQLHGAQLGDHGLRLLAGRLFALLGVDRLEHFCHDFDLGFGHNREDVAVEMHRAAMDISFCTNGYPTRDFNGPGQKQNCGYWIPRASAGSWKGFGSSRKRPSVKGNQGIYSGKNVLKIAYISVL